MKRFLPAVAVTLLFLQPFVPRPVSGGTAAQVTICGTGDSQVLLRQLAAEFVKTHPAIAVQVPESIGSSGGIRIVAEGKCDLGRTARPLREKEKEYGLVQRVFCLAPVVFAIHPGVGISGLTTSQVLAIYSGRITDWGELGGTGHPIYVASREAGDSCRTVLEEKLPGFAEVEAVGKKIYSTPETVETIGKHPGTIGYVPLAMIKKTRLRPLSLDGVAPSAANVRSGRYPFVIPLGLVWRPDLGEAARAFRDYLFSPAAQEVMIKYGAIPSS